MDNPGDRDLFLQKQGVIGTATLQLFCVSQREKQPPYSPALPALPGTGGTTAMPSSAAASTLLQDLP